MHDSPGPLETMRELRGALDATRAGRGAAVVLVAPPGGGTSSRLRAAALHAESDSVTVLRARGRFGERRLPFAVAVELFEPVWTSIRDRGGLASGPARAAAELLDGVSPAWAPESEDGRFAVIRGLAWLAHRIARPPADAAPPTHGLALVVDNLHDVDGPSLRLLAYIADRAATTGIALLGAQAPGLPSEDPTALRAIRAVADVVSLPPLTPDEAVAHIRATLPHASPRFCAACAGASGGNPGLLDALLAELGGQDAPPIDAGAERVVQTVPESVLTGVADTLARLPSPARALARAVAELGDGVTLERAGAAARIEDAQAPAALDALIAAGVLAPGLPLNYTAPLVRRAVRTSLTVGQRVALGRSPGEAEHHRATVGGIPETDSLTASERRVAELAARGMSTKQIATRLYVTAKTVEFHLRNVYRKLDVPSSRAELIRILGPAVEPPPFDSS